MTPRNPCFLLSGRDDHDARLWRRVLAALVRFEGIAEPDDLKVAAVAGKMKVTIAPGSVFVAGLQDGQGRYHGAVVSQLTKDLAAADPSQARTDLAVAQVHDAAEGDDSDGFDVEIVTGTPGVGVPAVPDNGYALAEIPVAAGATEPGTLVDLRQLCGGLDPVGSYVEWDGPEALIPNGLIVADARAVSRSLYADLFAVIGTTYGAGDGSTTFNLPDARGRTFIGLDDLGGTSANRVTAAAADTVGGTGGSEIASAPVYPTHTHPSGTSGVGGSHAHTPSGGGNFAESFFSQPSNFLIGGGAGSNVSDSTDATSSVVHDHPVTVSSVGGGAAHNNMHPYQAGTVCIAA